MTIQEALEQRRQNMQQAEQIRQAAKEARTWGVQQNSTLAFTPPKVEVPEEKKTSVDKMWDRNSQPVKIEATTRAKQKRDKAKTDYDNYVKSDEYRQKQAESVRAQQREMDKDAGRVFAPTSDFSSPAPQDEMEARLRREKDQAEAAFHDSED